MDDVDAVNEASEIPFDELVRTEDVLLGRIVIGDEELRIRSEGLGDEDGDDDDDLDFGLEGDGDLDLTFTLDERDTYGGELVLEFGVEERGEDVLGVDDGMIDDIWLDIEFEEKCKLEFGGDVEVGVFGEA